MFISQRLFQFQKQPKSAGAKTKLYKVCATSMNSNLHSVCLLCRLHYSSIVLWYKTCSLYRLYSVGALSVSLKSFTITFHTSVIFFFFFFSGLCFLNTFILLLLQFLACQTKSGHFLHPYSHHNQFLSYDYGFRLEWNRLESKML